LIHTPVCDLLGIGHLIVLGGMAGHTSVPLVAAVSNAGGLGTLGVSRIPAEQIPTDIAAIRGATTKPFGVNFFLFDARQPTIEVALNERPPVFAATWARADQDLRALFGRAHEAGSLVMYQAGTVAEALRAKAAGADVIVARGTEGGGHVGWMATMVVLPMIVDAVGPTLVLAAGWRMNPEDADRAPQASCHTFGPRAALPRSRQDLARTRQYTTRLSASTAAPSTSCASRVSPAG
jgi:NAD(P)H-dependent flavin oxidoreductase YrpB (nitropropane dioxygenase family)